MRSLALRLLFGGLILGLLVPACTPAKKVKPDPAIKAAQSARPLTPIQQARRIEVMLEEKDRLLADEPSAHRYVKQKLTGLLGRRLMEFGFDEARAALLASKAEFVGVAARGHQEKVKTDTGVEEKVIWDVGGKLLIDLDEGQIAGLAKRLDGLALDSLSAVEQMIGYLKGFTALSPDRVVLARLRLRVADRWAGLLGPTTKAVLDRPVLPLVDTMAALEDVAGRMRAFHQSFPDHAAHSRLEKQFILAALRAIEAVGIQADKQEALDARLAELKAMAGDIMPKLMLFLERKVELAWRDRLTKLDGTEKSFAKVRDDFVVYLRRFPKSEFYPELEKRFLKKWSKALIRQQVADMNGLSAMLGEARLMKERFSHFKGLPGVDAAVGKRCVAVLARVAVPDLPAWARVERLLSACEAYLPPGNKTVNMRGRLERLGSSLTKARDDLAEREALGDLAFLFEWDAGVRELAFGKERKHFPGQNRFAKLWEAGRDAGEQCRCSLDPDLPCRLFEVNGPAGGFEVVVRFYDGKLSGVDLCQLYAGPRVPLVYRFFSRAHGRRHSKRDAAMFQSGQGKISALRFGQNDKLQVVLERAQDMVTVKYRNAELEAKAHQDGLAAKAEAGQVGRKVRTERIERGWEAGDCVRWDCRPACSFLGNVRSKAKGRYEVAITDSFDDPRKVGRIIWVEQERLYDCAK